MLAIFTEFLKFICSNILSELLKFIGPEFSTPSGKMNFAGFIITLLVIVSPKLFKGAGWLLESFFKIFFNLVFKQKSEPPNFPHDKWGPWPAIVVFISFIICIVFTRTIA